MKKILILSLFLLSFYSYSQNSPCKTDAIMNGIYAQYPEMKTQSDYINNLIKNNNSQQRNFSIPNPGSITIPTVIYVIHEGANTPSYLSDT